MEATLFIDFFNHHNLEIMIMVLKNFLIIFALLVCQQHYCKSNQAISLTLRVRIGPTNGKN